nr:HepT-like ribonuclease domain-containing protein [uncultured Pedobacter sp.]
MLPSNVELLKHILEEVSFILNAVKEKNRDLVVDDPVLSRAIIRSLEIIGEASTKIDDEFKAIYPNVEWRKMSNTRNRLIHDYFGVDYDIVWDIIVSKLPDLEAEIQAIISEN